MSKTIKEAGARQLVTTGFKHLNHAVSETLSPGEEIDTGNTLTSLIQTLHNAEDGVDFASFNSYDSDWSRTDIQTEYTWYKTNGIPYIIGEIGYSYRERDEYQCTRFGGMDWKDLNKGDRHIDSVITGNGTYNRSLALRPTIDRYMEDFDASGVLQWGFMAIDHNGSVDDCKGMDPVYHSDWQPLYDMYHAFGCLYTGGQPPLGTCGASVDLTFVIDTTGSMDDDIAAVQAAATGIVDTLIGRGTNYRIAIVTYNDPADLTRVVLPFSSDRPTIVARLRSLLTGGGGDTPEMVYSGLMTAVSGLGWRSNTARSIILMGDAPPHDPEPATGHTLARVTAAANAGRIGVAGAARTAGLAALAQLALGPDSIRIYPVMIGGDSSARTAFQQLADQTGGSLFNAASAGNVVDAILRALDDITLAPVGDAGGPYSGVLGRPITLDGSGSRDPDGTIAEYAWDVGGDGTVDLRSTAPTATYTPTRVLSGSVTLRVTDNDGRSGFAQTGIAVASPTLHLPAQSGWAGQIVRVPVVVDQPVSGLAAASLTVLFDSRVLRPRGALAHPGSLTPGWAVAANDRTPGRLRVAMASAGAPVSGAGTLAELEFEVLGSPGSASPLEIARVSLNDGAIPTSALNGSFTVVPPRYQIGVRAVQAASLAPLANTTVRASGAASVSCLTDAGGGCALADLPGGTYTVALTKTDEVGAIGTLDASLILQHDSGARVLTGNPFTAGDVNGDGLVTALDANQVLQYVSGARSLPFPAGVVWRFRPISYAPLVQNQQATVQGVLLGDVSGYLPLGALGLRGAGQTLGALQLIQPGGPDAQGYRTALLWLQPGQEGPLSLAATLRFDPALVTDVRVLSGAPAGALAVAQVQPAGQVRLALAGARPLAAGALLTLRYRSGGAGGWSLAGVEANEGGLLAWQAPASAGWRLFLPALSR